MPAKTFTEIIKTATEATGCGVLVVSEDGKVLTGTRIERAGKGRICGPGGHIEPGERPEEAAKREAAEEFGIECHDLKPLAIQDGGRYGKSAVFLCTEYEGKPRTDEKEMTDPTWRTIEEIRESEAFPPFLQSLDLLQKKPVAKTFTEILKFNQNHDELGRFSESQGGGTHNNRNAGITDSDRKMFAGKSFSEFQKEELPGYFKAKKNGQPHPLSKYANEKGNLDPDRVEEAWYKTNLDESSKGAHKINTGEADRIIGENIPDSVLDGWFRQADSSYKPKIEEATIKNKDLRNAALNVAHENYNDYRRAQGNPPVDFEEWLTTPITVYRGERGQGHVEDDVFTAYSYDRKVAESFGPDVSEREIRPIDTLGGYRLNGEYEIMVPSRKFDVGVRKTDQTFEDESGRIRRKSSKITMAQKEGDEMADFIIYKSDDEKRLVFGWASVAITVDGEELEDRQHDMIDPEDLEEAAYEYVLNFRDTGEEHLPGYRKKGKLVESCVFTKEKQRAMGIPDGILPVAWWIGFYIEDDDAWQRVKNGTYKMFSIEGKAQREEIEKAARTARKFDDVLKFNPYHGYHGYFSSANAAGAFAPLKGKTENGQRLLNQYKEKHGGKVEEGSGGSLAPAAFWV